MNLTNGEKFKSKRCSTITVRKYLPEGPSQSGLLAVRITNVRMSGVLLYVPLICLI